MIESKKFNILIHFFCFQIMLQFTKHMFEQLLSQTASSTAADGVEASTSTRLTSAETEDEWVLVDHCTSDSEGNSRSSSMESLNIDNDEPDDGLLVVEKGPDRVIVVSNLPAPALLKRTNSEPVMEESWFLTPPPCFISTGPIHMETSPLENLLIEHPSMSVYTHHHPYRRHLVVAVTPEPDLETDVEEVDTENEEEVVVVRRLSRINRVHIYQQQQERQGALSKQAQKVNPGVSVVLKLSK